jgi:hypothetical protein
MNFTIHKTSLVPGANTLFVPAGTKFLSVGNQNNKPVIWYQFPTKNKLNFSKMTIVQCIMTGQDYDLRPLTKFIGTVLLDDGHFVLHVFIK